MIRAFITLLLCCSLGSLQAQHAFYYTISLNFKQTTATLLLVEYEAGGAKHTDTLVFNESVNLITKPIPQPLTAAIHLAGSTKVMQVFLANNQLQVIVDKDGINTLPYALEDEFNYLSANDNIRPQYFPLYGELNARKDSVGLKKLSIIFDSLRLNDIEKAKEYFTNNQNSLLSLYAFNRFASFSGDYSTLVEAFNKLPDWAKQSPDGKIIRAKIDGAITTQTGTVAKPFTQRKANGDLVRLSDYQGKYVLLDFWASWCGPCRKEHPDLLKAYRLFKDKNFEIVSISLDNNKEAWVKAIAKDGLLWPNVSDLKGMQNEVAILYGVQSIPANFLIDPDGKIIHKNFSGKELSDILNKLIGIK